MRDLFAPWGLIGSAALLALAIAWRLGVRYRRQRAARREPGFEPGDTEPEKPGPR